MAYDKYLHDPKFLLLQSLFVDHIRCFTRKNCPVRGSNMKAAQPS